MRGRFRTGAAEKRNRAGDDSRYGGADCLSIFPSQTVLKQKAAQLGLQANQQNRTKQHEKRKHTPADNYNQNPGSGARPPFLVVDVREAAGESGYEGSANSQQHQKERRD